ncbi:MAG: hypothetical protein M3198_12660 [Actinomycetota bacterium]|nr:hypothetical protein [Actinomycetota bacterium]
MDKVGFYLAQGDPAGGAPTEELIPATIVGLVVIALLFAFSIAHRSGRTSVLARLGDFSESVSGLPRWAAIPVSVTAGSLLIAVFGFYWDVATHIDNGRDPGPFANPAHYLIIIGLGGIALAGVIAILFGAEKSETTVQTADGWHAPVGGVLLLVCGGIAVLGFPLDDVWHRLFGQDVTLWSPTHIQMVGGAALSTIALLVLLTEGTRAALDRERVARINRFGMPAALGALLLGFSAFQAEFDFSVPQFRLLYHPVLLMLSTSAALVAARMRLGRGGALKAVGFYLLIRVLLSVIVGPVLDHTTLHFPLYIVEAIAIELVALRVGTEREMRFAMIAGAAVGTFGLAAEWLWSHLWMTMEWPASLLPEGVIFGLVAALAGASLGALIGRSIRPERRAERPLPRFAAPATALAIIAALAYPFPVNADLQGTANVRLEEADRAGGRWVKPHISFEPEDAIEGLEWVKMTSWQGGGSYVEDLIEVEEGVYTTLKPVPVHGEWKTLLRIHGGNSIVAVPIFLPEDPGIPAPEVPAKARFSRDFMSDKQIVLREAKDVDSSLTFAASGVLALLVAGWILSLAWGLRRIGPPTRRPPRGGRTATAPTG